MDHKPASQPSSVIERIVGWVLLRIGIASVLVVAGRKTGAVRQVTLVPIDVEGTRYLLATRGLSHWARNLRAVGQAALRSRGHVERIRTIEVDGAEYERVVEVWRRSAPPPLKKAYDRNPDAALHPAFRIELVGEAAV